MGFGRWVEAAGSRALERRVLADLRAHRESREREGEANAFREPLRLVVPTGVAREHWVACLTRELGPALLGVVVQTLGSAVAEIRRRARRYDPPAGALFEVAVRRAAEAEGRHAEELSPFEQSERLVERSVRELLLAGSWRGDGAAEHGKALRARDAETTRARWLLRVAERVRRFLDAQRLLGPGEALEDAVEAFERDGFRVFPARWVLCHGFDDGSPGLGRLLRAWLETGRATVYANRPRDPWLDAPTDAVRHARAFRMRVLERDAVDIDGAVPSRPVLVYVSASGTDAEVQDVAHRVRACLDAGVAPERMGIVARDPERWATALRRHFGALGIPFRGIEEPRDLAPLERRQRALRELLAERDAARLDRWFDVLATARHGADPWWEALEDLRLVCRSLGWTTIGELARADVREVLGKGTSLRLPSFAGRERVEELGDDDATDERRGVGSAAFREAAQRARRLVEELARWPARAPWDDHLERLATLVRGQLDRPDDPLVEELERWRGRVRALELDFAEFLLVLERASEREPRPPLGGDGGGCFVLDAARARGLTFEHLFLLGMNQDAFPRTGREDPLLPDAVRRRLHATLPGLALHAGRRDAERFLFAELLASAAHVTLSWQRSDEDGKLRNPSPFLQRLLLRDGAEERVARPVGQRLRENALSGRPLTAREHLLQAALGAGRDAWARRLEDVFADRDVEHPARLAGARVRILEEFDPDRRTPRGRAVSAAPGPWLGFLGTRERAPDEVVHVTHLEGYARCPWQFFLTRVLRLEAPLDPLESLPAIDGRMLGILVHDALQELVEGPDAGRGPHLAAARERSTRTVRAPDEDRVEAVLTARAVEVARENGLYLPGLQKVFARRARAYVDVALRHDWPNPQSAIEVLGCEVQAALDVAASGDEAARRIACRIDRVDRTQGRFLLTDYKTSRPHSASPTPQRVREDFRDQLEQGLRLQIAVYAATDLNGAPARARYLYLRPDQERVEFAVAHDDPLVREDLPRVLGRLLHGRDLGIAFPRLEGMDGVEPRTCTWCEVSLACVRSDSGQRARLRRIAEHARRQPVDAGTVERAFAPLWDPRGERPAAPADEVET